MPNLSRRDFLKIGGVTFLATALPLYGFRKFINPPQQNIAFKAPIIYHGSRNFPMVGLTYDDCQLVTRLHMLEDILKQYPEVRVTLFPVGNTLAQVDGKDPGIWKRFYNAGHEFGCHTFDHVNIATKSPADALRDYDQWYAALTKVLEVEYTVHFIRPPYDVVSYTLEVLCQERGLVATLFSIGGGGPSDVVMNAIRKYQNGDIIQFHTREQPAIPAIGQEESEDMTTTSLCIPFFKEQGVQCVTLSRLYDNLLREQINPAGCDLDTGASLTRTCVE